jgi:hypothetical protein
MVTVARLGKFKAQVYSDDHYPPHFHVVCQDFEVLVLISDLSILKGKRYAREITDVLDWASTNHDFLWSAWRRLND